MNKPKGGLGRGLDALLGSDDSARRDAMATLPVGAIRPGKYQPRTRMDEQALNELAASIRAQGLMQPLLVRPLGREQYELIAGERRWRAAQIAGLAEVPVLVREVADSAALAMALIENIQREDLNPIEEAGGLQRLVEEFRMTHEQAAEAVGRSRSATTNLASSRAACRCAKAKRWPRGCCARPPARAASTRPTATWPGWKRRFPSGSAPPCRSGQGARAAARSCCITRALIISISC